MVKHSRRHWLLWALLLISVCSAPTLAQRECNKSFRVQGVDKDGNARDFVITFKRFLVDFDQSVIDTKEIEEEKKYRGYYTLKPNLHPTRLMNCPGYVANYLWGTGNTASSVSEIHTRIINVFLQREFSSGSVQKGDIVIFGADAHIAVVTGPGTTSKFPLESKDNEGAPLEGIMDTSRFNDPIISRNGSPRFYRLLPFTVTEVAPGNCDAGADLKIIIEVNESAYGKLRPVGQASVTLQFSSGAKVGPTMSNDSNGEAEFLISKATPEQLQQMRELVRQEMEAGALGIGSSLIYAPAFYATTEELIEMCKVASQYQGKYISHIRSEGNQLIEGVQELLRIAREANIPAEIYHLKASGKDNWPKMDQVIKMIEQARKQGLKVTADMYTYTAGATGLNSTLPPWTLDGGYPELFKRLQDPETRKKIADEVRQPTDKWENMWQLAGSPERILLVGFRNLSLRQYIGKNIAEVGKLRGKGPIETIMDLIVEDRSRVDTVYFMMSEENVKKQLKLPWVSFGSDAASMAAEGAFLNSSTHPRAYGNFARLLGKYVRDEKVIPMEEAIRRLAALPCQNLGLAQRGLLKAGYFADVVIFDPKTIADVATFEKPHQYSVGMKHVFVNGVQELKDGEHTGKTSGRALWGPGKK